MTAAIRAMAGLDMPIVPTNDHPIREDYFFGGCIALAEALGESMVEVRPEDHEIIWQAVVDAYKAKCDEILERIKR